MKSVIISTKFKSFQSELLDVIDNFNEKGKLFDNRIRNKIKLFEFNGFTINVKSFKSLILLTK